MNSTELEEQAASRKLIRLIKMTLAKSENVLRVARKFEVREGLKQGDLLSLVLFNFALEKVIRGANINRVRLLYHNRHQCLPFEDDITILIRSRKKLQEVKE